MTGGDGTETKLKAFGVELTVPRAFGLAIIAVGAAGTIWWNWDAICERLPYCYAECRHPDHGIEEWKAAGSLSRDSGWVGGGSSPSEYCGGQLAAIQAANPDKRIELAGSNEDHKTERRPFKEDYYRYTCEFRVLEPIFRLAASAQCNPD